MKKKFQPKKLGLVEADFEDCGRRKDLHYGYEYNVFKIEKHKLVPKDEESELLSENMTVSDWRNIAKITCGDNTPTPTRTQFVFETSWSISELIELLEHNYMNHQFIKQFGYRLRYEEIVELYSEYTDMFDDVFKKYGVNISHTYNEEKQEAAAKELGLERIAYGSIWVQSSLCDKKKLYVGDIYYVNFMPKDYGGYPVYIDVDRSDMCKLSPNTNARIPNIKGTCVDRGEDDYRRSFEMQEPQRWKIGKLTDKKRIAWMEYIEKYFNGLVEFCDKRRSAIEESEQRLLKAGFVKMSARDFYKVAEYIRCNAQIGDNGVIYTNLEITDHAKLREKYFNY